MKTKVCIKCSMELPATTEFFSKNKQGKLGLRTDCKKCNKLRANAHYEVNKKLISSKQKAYYQKNKEKIAIVHKAQRDSHKEEIKAHRDSHKEETKAYNKAYRQSHKEDMKAYAKAYAKAYNESHKEEIAVYAKAYYQRPEVKEQRNKHCRNRIKTDINYKLARLLRARTTGAIKNGQKAGSAVDDLGCSVNYARQWLESQFLPGMTWKNHGEWHIDHVMPLCKFDLTDRDEFLIVSHYTNLQPLWAFDNLSKGGR